MSLNIKNEDVHTAVRELARALGVSQTSAVEVAVRAKLAELQAEQQRAARVERFHEALAAAQQAFDGVDLRRYEAELYDEETGLPR
ncbi:type II toxin-antitoxin system VapB family antitoxin [Microbacterium sp.]|uniref:type II toxin-antitoxin system VapB family antitoxin n=1 Tax=Microbacterium sp. TaxID=51671 RepID=UPI003C752907